eukprot:7376143-Prymnesium_polylepis.2
MVKDSLKWRVSYNLFSNIAEWYADESSEAEFLRRTWPCGCHGKDKRGVPVYYARYGLADMAASVEAAGFDRFLRFSLSRARGSVFTPGRVHRLSSRCLIASSESRTPLCAQSRTRAGWGATRLRSSMASTR